MKYFLGQALRILPNNKVKTYIATQAAISGHCYGSMKNPTEDGKIVELDNLISEGPDIYLYFHSGNRFYASGNPPKHDLPYLHDVPEKTNMINYYNLEDNALFYWGINNDLKKSTPSVHRYSESDGGLIYNYYRREWSGVVTLSFSDEKDENGTDDDRFEIFSYIAYSRSHTLGVGEIVGKNNFDLRKNIFKDHPNKREKVSSHLYHSWQFLQSFPETQKYWERILQDVSSSGEKIKLRNAEFNAKLE